MEYIIYERKWETVWYIYAVELKSNLQVMQLSLHKQHQFHNTNEYSLGNKLSIDFERTCFGLRCIAPLINGSRFSELKDTDPMELILLCLLWACEWLALDFYTLSIIFCKKKSQHLYLVNVETLFKFIFLWIWHNYFTIVIKTVLNLNIF